MVVASGGARGPHCNYNLTAGLYLLIFVSSSKLAACMMASLDLYKNQVLHLCSQIERLRTKTIQSRYFNNDTPNNIDNSQQLLQATYEIQNHILSLPSSDPLKNCLANDSRIDPHSVELVAELQKLSVKITELETLLENVGLSDSHKMLKSDKDGDSMTRCINDILSGIESLKTKGKFIHSNLIEEEEVLTKDIDNLVNHIKCTSNKSDLYHVATVRSASERAASSKTLKNSKNERIKQRSLGRLSKSQPSLKMVGNKLKLDEITIWDVRECAVLESICKKYPEASNRLALIQRLMPFKSQTEIQLYIDKFQRELDKRDNIKKQISEWKKSQVKPVNEVTHLEEVIDEKKDSNVSFKKPIMPKSIKESVARLSSPKRVISAKSDASNTGRRRRSRSYSAKERESIRESIRKYRENKLDKMHKESNLNKHCKYSSSNYNIYHERNKQFIEMKETQCSLKEKKMKEDQAKQQYQRTLYQLKYLSKESTVMKPTISSLIAKETVKTSQLLNSAVHDVNSIPKRKNPHWRLQKKH